MIWDCPANPLMIASFGVPQNALSSGDPKYRRVRTRNPAFQSRLGRYPEVGSIVWLPNSFPMVHRSQQCLHLVMCWGQGVLPMQLLKNFAVTTAGSGGHEDSWVHRRA